VVNTAKAMCPVQTADLEASLRVATAPAPQLTPEQRNSIARWAAAEYSAYTGNFYRGDEAVRLARGDVCGCCAQPITSDAYKVRGFWFRAECLRKARV
jgi:hypothetical protein